MNLTKRYVQTLYILNKVELFRQEPKLLRAWLNAMRDYGKEPPPYPPDNTVWWILKLGGYIQD